VFSPARSFHCAWCIRNWPPYEEFAVCPCCREETVADKQKPPMNEAEAQQLAIHFAFGWYLYDTGQL